MRTVYQSYRVLVKATEHTPKQFWVTNTVFASSAEEAEAKSRKEYRQFEVHQVIGVAD